MNDPCSTVEIHPVEDRLVAVPLLHAAELQAVHDRRLAGVAVEPAGQDEAGHGRQHYHTTA